MTEATSADINLVTTPAYCTYAQWVSKTGIGTNDEDETQFAVDLREAHELIRRKCFYLVRERIIFKDSNNIAFLPRKWIADGTMSGTIDSDDIVILELDDTGLKFDSVSNDTYLDSISAYNNCITLTDASSALTNQLYVVYYCASKPLSEVLTDELKRAVMAQVTILVIERLRLNWSLKGGVGWTAGGVSMNKDISAYEKMYEEAARELQKYISFIKPVIPRTVQTGRGRIWGTGESNLFASQFLYRNRIGNRIRRIW